MGTTKKKTSGGDSESGDPEAGAGSSGAAKKRGTKKSSTAPGAAKPVDPRDPVDMTPKNLEATLSELESVVAKLQAPAEPAPSDLVDAMMHIVFADGLPCGYGQEALRRIREEFVDRNEFRVTEAFEVEQLLGDLEIPELFDRCRTIQLAVNQIYADQNKVALDHLREAAVTERKNFFQRVPAIPPSAVRFLNDLLAYEEIVLSPRSTQRIQQRVGLDPKGKHDEAFVEKVRALLAPFGHLPLEVGKSRTDGKPILDPVLSPACLLVRLSPGGKK